MKARISSNGWRNTKYKFGRLMKRDRIVKKQKMWSKRIRRWIFAALVLSGCIVPAFSAALPVFAYSQAVIAASAARVGAATAPQKNSAAGTVSGKAASTTSASGNVPTPTPTLTPTPTPATKKKSGKWVRKKDYFYYYNENGKNCDCDQFVFFVCIMCVRHMMKSQCV